MLENHVELRNVCLIKELEIDSVSTIDIKLFLEWCKSRLVCRVILWRRKEIYHMCDLLDC